MNAVSIIPVHADGLSRTRVKALGLGRIERLFKSSVMIGVVDIRKGVVIGMMNNTHGGRRREEGGLAGFLVEGVWINVQWISGIHWHGGWFRAVCNTKRTSTVHRVHIIYNMLKRDG